METTLEFETALAEREEIKGQIASIEKQLSQSPSLNLLGMQMGQELERINGYLKQNGEEKNFDSNQQQTLALYRQRYATAKQQYEEAKAAQEALRAELAALQTELASLDCSCSLQELLAIQEEIAQVTGEVARIKQSITDQKNKVELAWAAVPSIKESVEKYQELLAQKEIGQSVDEALATAEQELTTSKQAAEEARATAETIAAKAEEIMTGLNRLLFDKEKRAKELQERIQPNAVKAFLLTRAEALGVEYAKAASSMVEKYQQLAALGNIMVNRDEKDRDLQSWRTARHLDLPVFPIASCKGLSSDRIRWHNPEAIQSERQALSLLGVQV